VVIDGGRSVSDETVLAAAQVKLGVPGGGPGSSIRNARHHLSMMGFNQISSRAGEPLQQEDWGQLGHREQIRDFEPAGAHGVPASGAVIAHQPRAALRRQPEASGDLDRVFAPTRPPAARRRPRRSRAPSWW
jgi:hypothetical protein